MAKLVDMSPEEIVDLYAASVENKLASDLTMGFFGGRVTDDQRRDCENSKDDAIRNLEALRPFLIACVTEGLQKVRETSDN